MGIARERLGYALATLTGPAVVAIGMAGGIAVWPHGGGGASHLVLLAWALSLPVAGGVITRMLRGHVALGTVLSVAAVPVSGYAAFFLFLEWSCGTGGGPWIECPIT